MWTQPKPSKRMFDLQLSNMQQVMRKVTFSILQTTNALLQNNNNNNNILLTYT